MGYLAKQVGRSASLLALPLLLVVFAAVLHEAGTLLVLAQCFARAPGFV
jgi:hypothetical protein